MVLRQVFTALRVLLVLTVVLGIAYPLAITGIGQAAFPHQANGSQIVVNGESRGSALLGQAVEGPGWFFPRPSAADYDAQASGGTNLGSSDEGLIADIEQRRTEIAAREGVDVSQVPAEAVTASASGLDPFISPEYAALQADRVATERGLPVTEVQRLIGESTHGRMLGFLGQPRVNVVALNAAVAEASDQG